jgi:hypothetical protein
MLKIRLGLVELLSLARFASSADGGSDDDDDDDDDIGDEAAISLVLRNIGDEAPPK